MTLRYLNLQGAQLADWISELARLRIRVFREFPYLYDGDEAYEARYLQTYLQSPRSLMVLVFDGEQVVGASSGLPLSDETAEVQAPFRQAGMTLARVFYCGESVLLPKYRGLGAGVEFFRRREAHAKALGGFDTSVFCAVQRPLDHPRRPANYRPLDDFWQHRGYQRYPQLQTTFSWQDLDETRESAKPMVFWLKHLTNGEA